MKPQLVIDNDAGQRRRAKGLKLNFRPIGSALGGLLGALNLGQVVLLFAISAVFFAMAAYLNTQVPPEDLSPFYKGLISLGTSLMGLFTAGLAGRRSYAASPIIAIILVGVLEIDTLSLPVPKPELTQLLSTVLIATLIGSFLRIVSPNYSANTEAPDQWH